MLSKETFKKGLEEIEIAFTGFVMTKPKADIWYKYSNHLSDRNWLDKIANCIKGCSRIPTLADILDWRGYHINKKEEDRLMVDKSNMTWSEMKKEEEKFEYKPIPVKIKKFMDKVLHRSTNSKDRKKLKELE